MQVESFQEEGVGSNLNCIAFTKTKTQIFDPFTSTSSLLLSTTPLPTSCHLFFFFFFFGGGEALRTTEWPFAQQCPPNLLPVSSSVVQSAFQGLRDTILLPQIVVFLRLQFGYQRCIA